MKILKQNFNQHQEENQESVQTLHKFTSCSKGKPSGMMMMKSGKLPRIKVPTPVLLLSYTYFLNPYHTCYISIGYDVVTFKLKIIIYKNMIHQEWCFEDWEYLYKNSLIIQNKILEGDRTLERSFLKNSDGNQMSFKVSTYRNRKTLTFKIGASNINFNIAEWSELYKIMNFVTSVLKMYNSVWYEVEQYYNLYYNRCNQLQVNELPQNEYFIPIPATYNYCNFSRLFNEIPVLCQEKLQNDRYFNISNNAN